MSDTKTTRELYGLYVRKFGSCPRTPYQADYYRKWLELLESCSSNEEAEEKSKQNGLYTAGAGAVAMDRVYATKQAAEKLGWADVVKFCDEAIEKLKADPYYCFTHSGMWGDLEALKGGWIRTIEGFHKLFSEFLDYDSDRTRPERLRTNLVENAKMLTKPSPDFAKLAAMPQFRALIDCSDDYYNEFVKTVRQALESGQVEEIKWSTGDYASQISEIWEKRDTLKAECDQWYAQPEKPVCVRLSPNSPDGKYELVDID